MTTQSNTRIFCHLNERDAELVHKLVASHCQALKNWIASAVEGGNAEYAKTLVHELRVHEHLFAKTNVETQRHIDALAAEQRAKEAAK
jgi:hypothetical protein